MMPTAPLRVAIGVLTYLRPNDLAELLSLLIEQADAASDAVRIVVVDNDPAASARALCEQHAARGIRYQHEPEPGISAARNRVLDETRGDDVLIFIDDDERPTAQWLQHLLALYRAERPAGVVGPVVSRYEHSPDEFIEAGRFFERRRLPTGTPVEVAATNNLLLDVRQASGLRFDPDFGISGGSDTLFTRQLTRAGGRLLWCDEAIVYDIVPAARLTRHWVLRRAFRMGNAWSRTSVRLASNPAARAATRLRLTAEGAARLLSGASLQALGALARAQHLQARGLRRVKRGSGMVSGAWGHVYSEYRRP